MEQSKPTPFLDAFDVAVRRASDWPENLPDRLESDLCNEAMAFWQKEIRAFLEGVEEDQPDGVKLIMAERIRQIQEEGWTVEHDNQHTRGELVDAGLSYIYAAINNGHPAMSTPPPEWPWDKEWWKPTPNDCIRELVKAGALIAAEIDRLQRLAEAKS